MPHEQHHEVIAFAEDHEAGRRPDRAGDVQHGVCVTGERSNAGRPAADDRPDKRLRGLRGCLRFAGADRLRLAEGHRTHRAAKKYASPHVQTQFSVLSPTTRPKCWVLFVTNVNPNERA